MEPQRYLRCLGQPALFTGSGEPIRFRTRKHLALLVYIAVEDRSHRRDRLAELLWPKVSSTEARHSLATALSILRPRLGLDGLETSRDHVRLVPGRVTLDLERLRSGDVLGSEVSGPLEVAAFLDGFDINDSAEFTHWKDRQQARLLPVIKDALLVLIDRCRRTGDSRQIEQLADRMLALDELCEEAVRAKMEARAFAGDRLTALEIFEAWKKKLAEELQAAPSELVEGMAVRLRRRGWERTTLANIPNVPTDQWRGRPFIGRTAEYRVLYELWEGVRKGTPGHALILGDSGVGKTTLVQRLTTAAGLEGAAISRVQCYDLEREIPYSTISSLILGLLDRPGVSATSPEALAELSRTVPEVRHRFSSIPLPSESHGETARIRFTESFLEMINTIAEEHPVILVIDDLHLADDVSLAVLHLVIRRSKHMATMMLLIARSSELSQSTQAGRLRDNVAHLGIQEIKLEPLDECDSRAMLLSLIQADEKHPTTREQHALLKASSGFPMVLELLVQDWKCSGEHSLAMCLEAMTRDISHGNGVGQSVYYQILNRISGSLTNVAHNVLNLAAILGRRLNDLRMYDLIDLSVGQTMCGMAELVDRRVLRDGDKGLEFVNELVRAAAYLGVPQTLRHTLHGCIADRLIQQDYAGNSDLGLEIAWHCIRGGRCDEATGYLLTGARQAMRTGAMEAAEKALSSALAHLSGSKHAEAVILLAEVLQEQGRWQDSLTLLEIALDTAALEDWRAVLRINAMFHLYGSSPERTTESLRALIRVMRDSVTSGARIAAARTASTLLATTRDVHQARLALDALALIPTADLDEESVTKLFLAKARITFQLNKRTESLSDIEGALEGISPEARLTTTAAQLYTGLGVRNSIEGAYLNAVGYYESALNIALRLGNESLRMAVTANLALMHGRLGNYQQQLQFAEESLSTVQSDSADYNELLATYCAAFGCIFIGKPSRARELIATTNSRVNERLAPWALQAWQLYSADLHILLGDNDESRRAADLGTSGNNAILHARDFAGVFCRWKAKLATTPLELQGASEMIQGFFANLQSFDALDRAEIVASLLVLQQKWGRDGYELSVLLDNLLRALPDPVSYQMKCLQVLRSQDTSAYSTPFASRYQTSAS